MGSTSSNIFTVALVFSEAICSGGACELYNLNGCIIRSTVHTKEFLTLPRNKMMLVKLSLFTNVVFLFLGDHTLAGQDLQRVVTIENHPVLNENKLVKVYKDCVDSVI